MATDARKTFAPAMQSLDVGHDLRMTLAASAFRNFVIAFVHEDLVRVTTGGEGKRVPESVFGLGQVFGDEARRGMTIIANGDGAVTGLEPTAVVIFHHVAIGTSLCVICQIRG